MARKSYRLRKRIIGFAIFMGLSAMGAGYAAWNDTLNITSNISTGHMDVRLAQESHCKWYVITIGRITGVAKVKLDIKPNENLIDIEITKALKKLPWTKCKGDFWIGLPIYIMNDGSLAVESEEYYGSTDKYMRICGENLIGSNQLGRKILNINLMQLQDGNASISFKPSGFEGEGGWREDINIKIEKVTICDIIGGLFSSMPEKDNMLKMETLNMDMMRSSSTTSSAINPHVNTEEIPEEELIVDIQEISEEEGEALFDQLMNQESILPEPFVPDINDKTTPGAIQVEMNSLLQEAEKVLKGEVIINKGKGEQEDE